MGIVLLGILGIFCLACIFCVVSWGVNVTIGVPCCLLFRPGDSSCAVVIGSSLIIILLLELFLFQWRSLDPNLFFLPPDRQDRTEHERQ